MKHNYTNPPLEQLTVYMLMASTAYRVRVAASNGVSPVVYSDSIDVATTAVTQPSPPSTPRAKDFSGNFINLEWDGPVDEGGVVGSTIVYDVYIDRPGAQACSNSTVSECIWLTSGELCCLGELMEKMTTSSISVKTFEITNLIPVTRYGFRVVRMTVFKL